MKRLVIPLLLLSPAALGAALEKYGTGADLPPPAAPAPADAGPTVSQIREEARMAVQKFKALPAADQRRVAAELVRKRTEAEQSGSHEAWLYYRLVIEGIGGGR